MYKRQVEDSRNLHRSKFNWEDAKQRTRKGTLQNKLWQGMEQLRQMRADPCFAPAAWVTTWDSHNPGVLALVRTVSYTHLTTIALMAGHSTVMICWIRFAPSIIAASFRSLLALERDAVYMMDAQDVYKRQTSV